MSSEDKPMSMHEEVASLWKRILGANAFQVLMFAAMCVGVALYAQRAMAEDAHRYIDAGISPLAIKLASHEHEEQVKQEQQDREVVAITRRIEAVERVTLETSLNVRLLVEAAKLRPIYLMSPDAGIP